MNRDDVIRMAREAGLDSLGTNEAVNFVKLQRFARLVAAHEKKRAEQDSLRYRWLRDVGDETWIPLSKRSKVEGYDINAFIDAAIRQRGSAD